MYADLFQKISGTCFEKCASRKHRDQDLALGEMACTDRCVSKYMEAMEKVAKKDIGVLEKLSTSTGGATGLVDGAETGSATGGATGAQ